MLKPGNQVVVVRDNKNQVGKILERTKFKKMKTFTVKMETGNVLQFVRVNRHKNFCAAYIDTKLTKIFNEGKKL